MKNSLNNYLMFLSHIFLFSCLIVFRSNAQIQIDKKMHLIEHSNFGKYEYFKKNYDVKKYSISGRLNWSEGFLQAQSTIDLTITGEPKEFLIFDSRVEVLSVKANKKMVSFESSTEQSILKVKSKDISSNLKIGDHVFLTIQYKAKTNIIGDRMNTVFYFQDRKKDIINSEPAFYTKSEPTEVRLWMPVNMDPSDEAQFEIQLALPPQYNMISNGLRVVDKIQNGERIIAYRLNDNVPQYTLGFFAGQLVTETKMLRNIPISVVAQKGADLNLKYYLDRTIEHIKIYEALMGPYPYPSFNLVFTPECRGMEHVTISFVEEDRPDEEVIAHELAHQWFGDKTTVKSWEDLWIKEGMATLLQFEATRYTRDRSNQSHFFGRSMYVEGKDKVIDEQKPITQRYHSGPYGRAAFVHNQIRVLVGDGYYWSLIRKILKEHRNRAISTEEFLKYFKPHMQQDQFDKIVKSLRVGSLFQVAIKKISDTSFSLSLKENEPVLVIPLVIELHYPDASIKKVNVEVGKTVILDLSNINYMMVDPKNDFLSLEDVIDSESKSDFDDFMKYLIPKSNIEKAFAEMSGPMQSQLNSVLNETLTPEQFANYFNLSKSERFETSFLNKQCGLVIKSKNEKLIESWKIYLPEVIKRFDYSIFREVQRFGQCGPLLSDDTIQKMAESLQIRGPEHIVNLNRFISFGFNSSADYPALINRLREKKTYSSTLTSLANILYFKYYYDKQDKNETAVNISRAYIKNWIQESEQSFVSEFLSYALINIEEPAQIDWNLIRVPFYKRQIRPNTKYDIYCSIKAKRSEFPDAFSNLEAEFQKSEDPTLARISQEHFCD